uniref:Uncharacterized protein n=1 Tax=Brassica oleracea TaxID=3712 RepID=A0A3P6G8Z5_BRAOL|nr:unnamed protein product [Brassica oleracea]
MLMFHRRSMQSSSPYASRRIAFLDRWFVKSWVNDFEKQDKNSIELSDMYSKAFNGEYPEQFYIECLAIGCTFHGLSDEIIPAQRMKLAAEIYEEVAEVDAEGSI